MDSTPATVHWDSAYESLSAPWLIGQPQPAIVELERAGLITGAVLDVGCGAGEHTIHLTALGYDVLGVDLSPRAIDHARSNATAHGTPAHFEVANALDLGAEPRFDTIVDSALFHIFDSIEDRAAYLRSLHAVLRPGGRLHILALAVSDEPGFGPRIPESAIRDAVVDGWELEDLRPTRYRARVGEPDAARSGLRAGTIVDLPAHLARARRGTNLHA